MEFPVFIIPTIGSETGRHQARMTRQAATQLGRLFLHGLGDECYYRWDALERGILECTSVRYTRLYCVHGTVHVTLRRVDPSDGRSWRCSTTLSHVTTRQMMGKTLVIPPHWTWSVDVLGFATCLHAGWGYLPEPQIPEVFGQPWPLGYDDEHAQRHEVEELIDVAT